MAKLQPTKGCFHKRKHVKGRRTIMLGLGEKFYTTGHYFFSNGVGFNTLSHQGCIFQPSKQFRPPKPHFIHVALKRQGAEVSEILSTCSSCVSLCRSLSFWPNTSIRNKKKIPEPGTSAIILQSTQLSQGKAGRSRSASATQ